MHGQVYRDYVSAATEWRAGLFLASAVLAQFLMIYKVTPTGDEAGMSDTKDSDKGIEACLPC